jgi:hypothetical protein
MGYLLFCDVDEAGNIIVAFTGTNIIPSRQYDFFFFTNDADVADNIANYKVDLETRILIKKVES